MSASMRGGPELTRIIMDFLNLNLEPSVTAHIRSHPVMSFLIWSAMIWWRNFLWNIIVTYMNEARVVSIILPLVKRNDYFNAALLITIASRILTRTLFKRNAYIKAALLISMDYATLLLVNARYISVVIIPIIMLVFVRALYVVVTTKKDLKSDHSNYNEASNKTDGRHSNEPSKADGKYGADCNDNGLLAKWLLPSSVLCCICMGHSYVDSTVVSQFLVFLTSALDELVQMTAAIPSKVAKAFETILHRSTLVVLLVTAHTMTAELLGDEVVLVYLPQLITFLIWFSNHFSFSHGSGGSATITIDRVTSHRNGIFSLITMVIGVKACLTVFVDGSEGATDMLCTLMQSVLVSCCCSVALLSVCLLVLHHLPAKTTAAPSLELKEPIDLLTFFREIMFITSAGSLATLVYLQLRQ